jgi:hypothetical protein
MRMPDRRFCGVGMHVAGFARPMRRLVRPCFAWSMRRLSGAMVRAVLRGENRKLFSVPLFVVRFPARLEEIVFGQASPAETHPGITMMYMTLGRD